jgi:hypothetical protein
MNVIEKSKPIKPESVLMGFNNPQSQAPEQNLADDQSSLLTDLVNQNFKE